MWCEQTKTLTAMGGNRQNLWLLCDVNRQNLWQLCDVNRQNIWHLSVVNRQKLWQLWDMNRQNIWHLSVVNWQNLWQLRDMNRQNRWQLWGLNREDLHFCIRPTKGAKEKGGRKKKKEKNHKLLQRSYIKLPDKLPKAAAGSYIRTHHLHWATGTKAELHEQVWCGRWCHYNTVKNALNRAAHETPRQVHVWTDVAMNPINMTWDL